MVTQLFLISEHFVPPMDVNYAVRQTKITSEIFDKLRHGGTIREAAAGVIQKVDTFLECSCHGRCFDRI